MSIGTRLVVSCALVLGGALHPARLAAQETTPLVGSVRDSSGRPVSGAELRVTSIGGVILQARTNDAGGFSLPAVPVGRRAVVVRRLGFAPATTEMTLRPGRIDSLVVSLTTVVAQLPGVLVEDEYTERSHRMLAGFWDRRSRGFGNFMTRDEIEARQAESFVDLVRRMPSTNIVTINGRPTIRMKRSMLGRDCPPQYIVDGMRIEQGQPDEFFPADVEAIEVYAGPSTVPIQFSPRPNSYTCGAIVIWTRLPGG